MKRSENITELMKALACFRGKVGKVKKDANNPFFKSSYASLPHILEAIERPLDECGLSFTQLPDGHGLTTVICHTESGQYMESTFEMVPQKNDPQGWGSAITYNRRYSLVSVLGLNVDEDDDGNKASTQEDDKPWLNVSDSEKWEKAVRYLADGGKMTTIRKNYKISKANAEKLQSEALER